MLGDRQSESESPRVGSRAWLEASGGRLNNAQRLRMLGTSIRTQRDLLIQRVGPRKPPAIDVMDALEFPDSRLVREAENAAAEQSPQLLAHSYRSAIFASALARIDGVDVDHELLIVCGLLHDVGLIPSVAGEDFTLRSARIASDVADACGHGNACDDIFDAIVVHTTVGVDATKDGALGAYTQFGAMVDLVGLRERHLPREFVMATTHRYPRVGFPKAIIKGLHGEARAVPGGRFDFVRRVGFGPAIRIAAVPSRP